MSIVMGVDYDEGKQSSYRAITLHMQNDDQHRFESGSPTEDMRAAYRFLLPYIAQGWSVLGSSSMDHFVMDGRRYEYRMDEVLASEGLEAETLQRVIRIKNGSA